MGNMKLAKKMILEAKRNGADLVKTQIFDVKHLKYGPWFNDGRVDIYKKAQLNEKKYLELLNFSKKNKINFFASVMNIDGAKFILKFQKNLIKIPSMEIANHELLKFCEKKFKKIIVSTGTATLGEIKILKKIIPGNKLIVLHCTSSYPCNSKDLNLPKINILKKYFKNVGFSDHSLGINAGKIAATYNISYIEKHFTINNNLPGRDNKFAILPKELKELKDFYSFYEEANKFRGLNYLKSEREARKLYRGRWGKV